LPYDNITNIVILPKPSVLKNEFSSVQASRKRNTKRLEAIWKVAQLFVKKHLANRHLADTVFFFMEQHVFAFSLIIEGTTEKVLQFQCHLVSLLGT
jgi:hypothetical protein